MDKLDLTQPLEAVHKATGAVALVSLWAEDADCFIINAPIEGCWIVFQNDGSHLSGRCPWSIRNADLTAKPSTPSNEELTQRMEKLVRLLAECEPCGNDEGEIKMIAIAKAIVSDLPKPVDPIDPDDALAESIADDIAEGATSFSHHDLMMAALDGIRAGRNRTLAAEGTAHE